MHWLCTTFTRLSYAQACRACASAFRCIATRAPVLQDPNQLAALVQQVLPALQHKGPGLDTKAHVVRGTTVLVAQGPDASGILQTLLAPLAARAQQALGHAGRSDLV